MSGKRGHEQREGDWKCSKCDNSNFAWRTQCNRCRAEKDSSQDGGLGVGTAVMLGVGAAAVGFLAKGLWSAFQKSSPSPCYKSFKHDRPGSHSYWTPGPSQSTNNGEKPDNKDKLGTKENEKGSVQDKDMPDVLKCVVCLFNPRKICLHPCGHACLCEDCAEKIKPICPICMQKIEKKTTIFL